MKINKKMELLSYRVAPLSLGEYQQMLYHNRYKYK
jgi:hypothetical protein